MMLGIYREASGRPRWSAWLQGWLELADALVQVLSLGYLGARWGLDFMFWSHERMLTARLDTQGEK